MKRVLAVVIGLVLAAAAVPAVAQQCPSGVVGYWPMDGDGNEVVNGIAGALVGNVTFGAGVVGQAAFFDGAGSGAYVDAGFSPQLSDFGGNQMSLAAWIYREPDGPAGDGDSAVITARTFCNEGNWQLYSALGNQVYYSKWLDGPEDQVFSGAQLPFQEWTHLVVTYAANEVRFYVDGALFDAVSPLQFGGAINDEPQNVQIGWDSCGSYFTGGLDEVAIFNTTLSDTEVADLFVKGFNGLSFCSDDADDDGVTDDLDTCPFTTGVPLVDGCDCEQILAFKPGQGGNCNNGTLNVFANRIGWATEVPLPPGQ